MDYVAPFVGVRTSPQPTRDRVSGAHRFRVGTNDFLGPKFRLGPHVLQALLAVHGIIHKPLTATREAELPGRARPGRAWVRGKTRKRRRKPRQPASA
jgi:hypothetical protein